MMEIDGDCDLDPMADDRTHAQMPEVARQSPWPELPITDAPELKKSIL